jgi:hypothetical protein
LVEAKNAASHAAALFAELADAMSKDRTPPDADRLREARRMAIAQLEFFMDMLDMHQRGITPASVESDVEPTIF